MRGRFRTWLPGAAVWLSLALAGHATAQETPTIPVGSDAYAMWDRWAYQRIGVRAYMRSTYDRSGGNEWADASHFLRQGADNVTLDVAGAGVLYFARYNHWHGSPWRYRVDGRDYIVSESTTADPSKPVPDSMFLPRSAFPQPLALTWSQTKGSDLSWAPIGFQDSFLMAYGRTFYGTGYYIYHQFSDESRLSQPIPSWTPEALPDPRISDLLQRAGSDIAPPAGGEVIRAEGRLNLAAKATADVWRSESGPRTVRALEFSVPRDQALAASRLRLRITWDGRKTPSVDVPLALFYGAGVLYNRSEREYLVKSLPMVVRYEGGRVYLSCYFPMPFHRSAHVQLIGLEDQTINDVRWSVRTTPYRDPPNHVGYFHATYKDFAHPKLGQDLVLLDTRETEGGGAWSGSFVGTSFIFSHNAQLTTLEGDPRFFFDDSQTPQAQGTGTEEWAGGGDYWGGENMSLPLAGHPVGARTPAMAKADVDKIESAYRFLLADLMPFGRNAVLRLEHGGVNESAEHYETVAYWYGLPAASLIKTDELVIGDLRSERQHRYSSPEASKPYDVTSRYEWGPDTLLGREMYPEHTDRGRTTRTASEFTLKIDPSNVGIMLRRKLDYAFPNQRAEVMIADQAGRWKLAGVWYTAGSNTVVGSFGGIGRQLQTFQAVRWPLLHAQRIWSESQTGGTPYAAPSYIEYANTLMAAGAADVSTAESWRQLRALTADFLAKPWNGPNGQELGAFAKELLAALDVFIPTGYEPRRRDEHEAGPNESIVQTSNRRFRDDEFLIPRRLTEGRDRIRVRVKFTPVTLPLYPEAPVPELAWSEMRYTAYAFVAPAFDPASPRAPSPPRPRP